ncbi:oxidoreductase NAD-binding domain protein [Rhodococcus sp. MTM3W5.2]|uniref:FAD-binding oxidoreductase n=1 Tax=Rhodococcus sp. MTM3W5.2 TaxID=1805827 RepID=UPI000979223D|nr:FAD-binding oxidoreductase [Rhodococcus sp. MTM3W5.2]AQA24937.1 oxidoreductase NAD-binding domain protein [Rhodococcus sp. MTM3W5.2]
MQNTGVEQQVWTATVVEHHRLRTDLAVVRLEGEFVPFTAGQSVSVTVPQNPRVSRRYSPALPPSLDGKLEFHVRTVPAGWISGAIVGDTAPGDQWQISEPSGRLSVDDSGRDVVMVAGGTGLAPFRSIILELARRPRPPRVYLFIGGRHPRDLYGSDMLWILAQQLDWLTVVPVVEDVQDPEWADEWYDRTRVDIGFGPDDLIAGTLAEVVSSYGAYTDHQVLVCGSPAMVRFTLRSLIDSGTPAGAIQFE